MRVPIALLCAVLLASCAGRDTTPAALTPSQPDIEATSRQALPVLRFIGHGFKNPAGVAIDPDSKGVYVADLGNNRLERVDADGKISVLSTEFRPPSQLAFDRKTKVLYFTD